ncbi:DUF2299 domain-containing protein [Caldisphaera sp.]|mgnify:CR=1 FL=1|uniref:DUF2299 domain-containing protein n=1 Tax=Caldisphaera sp. TaxID=2060322 RepID=UPI0025C6B2F4|nr:DUF2299 domain-containing protein [Caldisphaera sp.]
MSLKEEIIRWLKEENLEVSEIPIPKEAPIEWAINAMVTAPFRVSISIQRPKGKTEKLACTMGVKIADQHKEKIIKLSEQEKASMIGELLKSLYFICPTCVIIIQPDLINPDNIIVTKIIYSDKISASEITDSVRLLSNSYGLIVTHFTVKLGGSFKQGEQTMMHI